MKAKIDITFKDGSKAEYVDGDFFSWQMKNDLEDRNTAFVKIGDAYISKSEIRSMTANIINEKEGEAE